MERVIYELADGAVCELFPAFVPADEAPALLATLSREVPWQARAIRIFGREVLQPRLVAWIGDPDARYTYSGTAHDPLPWTPQLERLRTRISAHVGTAYNAVLCNLYRDGRDSMGMHADDEPELGPEPVIASLSLGAVRRFVVRHRRGRERGALDLALPSGSLLVMRGTMQRHYRHGVPKEPRIADARINLTFRCIHARAAKLTSS